MNNPLIDTPIKDLFEWKDLKDPSFLGCCLFPSSLVAFVVIGMLYKFGQWAFGG